VLRDPRVKARAKEGLTHLAAEGGSSTYAARALLMAEPPSIDANEITDKGYINQRAVLARRAAQVETLHADPAGTDVIRVG
jgi:feruloyl-CoA synthase